MLKHCDHRYASGLVGLAIDGTCEAHSELRTQLGFRQAVGAKCIFGVVDSEIRFTSRSGDPYSSKSCGTGKNLQRYSRNLFMSPPSNNKQAEQQIGRTHRSEQHADRVEVEMLYSCLEDWCAYQKAESAAGTAQDDLTSPRKLLLAQHVRCGYPVDAGPAWEKPGPVVVQIPE